MRRLRVLLGFSLRQFGGDTWIGLLQDVFAVLIRLAWAGRVSAFRSASETL